MIIKNASVYTEQGVFITKDIFIENDRIVEFTSDHSEIIDGEGLYAIPGLTDIHFHGCSGYDFCDGSHEAIETLAIYQAEHGVTSICPSTMTLSDDKLTEIFTIAGSYEDKQGADLVGIHMEGPYLSIDKKGAQDGKYMQEPNLIHFQRMNQLSGNKIKLVTVACEEDHAMDFIHSLRNEVVVALGHTKSNYETAMEAIHNGASHVTHLFNAMTPLNHRSPGVIGAAFDTDCTVELICDGNHISPVIIRLAFKLYGSDRIILVSDSMMATGMDDGIYSLGGQAVYVKGTRATLEDGTLAGSITNLFDCMRMAVSYGIPLEEAIKCASINPAKKIGIYKDYGSITPGKYANIVLTDKTLNLKSVILKGKLL